MNAFTSQDQTQYIASVPSDMIEQWFSIASEQLFEPSWREFYVERDVVQREWDFRYVNNPEGAAWLDLNANAYTAHPYRNPVIGWKSDMERYSTQDAMEFHGRYYNPTNAVCVLAGDVTVAEARRLAEIYFERYPAGRRAPEIVTAEPRQQGPRRSVRFLEGARTPVVRIGFHGAPMTSPDFFALDALTMVLSQGRSARLTQRIVNQGLAVEAWASNPDNRYGGLVVLGGSPNEPEALRGGKAPEAEARAAYAAACEELERLLLAEVEKLKIGAGRARGARPPEEAQPARVHRPAAQERQRCRHAGDPGGPGRVALPQRLSAQHGGGDARGHPARGAALPHRREPDHGLRDPGRGGAAAARALRRGALDHRQRGHGARAQQARGPQQPLGLSDPGRLEAPLVLRTPPASGSTTRMPSASRSATPRSSTCPTPSCRSST